MVRNIFPPMLILTRVIMNRIQEPQKEMISSRLNARKLHASIRTFHSSATRLWNETELSQQLNATQCNFCRAEVTTSCDFIAILVQFVSANVSTRLLLKEKPCVC